MFRRKSLATLTLPIALTMLLSACGGTTPTATTVAPTATVMAAPTATTAMAAPTDTAMMAAPTDTAMMAAPTDTAMMAAPTNTAATSSGTDSLSGTVTFWTAYNTVSPEMDTLNNTIIPAFQKLHPNVTVTAQALPYDDLRTKLLTAVAGGETPDLVRADIIWVPEFADMGALAPLDTEMSDFSTVKDAVYPGPLDTNFYQGHYYGLPLDTNTRVFIYNKDVLAAAGLTAAPKTFDEFKTACDKVKALGKADTYCYAEGGTGSWSVLPWIWSNGGDITDPTYTKATGYLNGPGTVGAVTMLKQMLDDKTLSPSILGNGISTSDALGKSTSLSILDGPWMPPIFTAQYPDLKYDMATVPAGPGGSVSVVGGEDIVMFEASKNKEAAKAFMEFMLTEEPQVALGKVGQMPVLKSLQGSSELPSYYSVFQTQLLTAKPRTPSPAWPKIDDAINTAVLSVMRGEMEPQAALDAAATTVDGLLAGKK